MVVDARKFGRCETWMDHTWSVERVVDIGRHDTNGPYSRSEQRCETCGRVRTETTWLRRLPSPAVMSTEGFEAE